LGQGGLAAGGDEEDEDVPPGAGFGPGVEPAGFGGVVVPDAAPGVAVGGGVVGVGLVSGPLLSDIFTDCNIKNKIRDEIRQLTSAYLL
jgi:hypothetical protein